MTNYGLTSAGFKTKSQQVIIAEIQSKISGIFGNNINFAPSSNFGQLVGIFSERESLLWQLTEGVYGSQYPSGAEGTSVDNILALNNMKRDKAKPTRSDPTAIVQSNGIIKNGLVVKGTAGTVVVAKSFVQTNQSPPLQFKIDSDIVIQAAINAVQGIYLSNVPTVGNFSLQMPNGEITNPIEYNAISQSSKISFASIPSSGNWSISLTLAGSALVTASLAFNATAAQVQSAIRALAGYSSVIVTGDYSSGFSIDFSSCANPVVFIATNTTTVIISEIQSIQSKINNLIDSNLKYPYTDATVIISSQGYAITFGNGFLVSGQVSCGFSPQPLIVVNTNTLESGSNITNIKIVNSIQGASAQGIGTATCVSNGPNFVAAGSLNTIGSPISGWDSVSNDLDCITGTNDENDLDALTRRSQNLQANANGPLQAVIEKVKAVANVTAAVGDENVYIASRQKISFSSIASSGAYKLSLNGILTAAIAFNATAAQVQIAIRAVSGYENAIVKGDNIRGFTVDYNGSFGGKELPLIQIQQNTTGVSISSAYGLSGKAMEIIVEGGDDTAIAEAILGAKPGGILMYGSTMVQLFDQYQNAYYIGFSRPTPVPIYVTINLVTDLTTAESPKFNILSISDIQKDIVNIGNAVGIGGLIIAKGTDGLIGAFNNVQGIIDYDLFFDRVANPTAFTNIQLLGNEAPKMETFLVAISYT